MSTILSWVIKILFSCAAAVMLCYKVDWVQFSLSCERIQMMDLFFVFLLYNLSQVLSAHRSYLYLRLIDVHVDRISNLCLCYVGMFYNLFLPGGIGGDAYKVYQLRKYHQGRTFAIVQAMIFDRLNGFLGLLLIAAFALYFSDSAWPFLNILWSLPIVMALLVVVCANIQRSWFKYDLWTFLNTLALSVLSQLIQTFVALYLLFAMGEMQHIVVYALVFLTSSIIAQLPISLGGLGARELTVFYLLNTIGISPEFGVAMAVCFFVVQTLSNCLGAAFIHRELKLAA